MKKRVYGFTVVFFLLVALFGVHALAAEVFDLGGATVRISTRFRDITPLGQRGDFNWYQPDARLLGHIESVEKMLNVKVEFVSPFPDGSLVNDVMTELLAGDVSFDLVVVSLGNHLPSLVGQGALLPLTNVLETGFYEQYLPETRDPGSYSILGDIYGLDFRLDPEISGGVIWNKSLFEREGFPDPYELYESGEWTWDVVKDLAIRATKDTSGDGEVDQWGFNFPHSLAAGAIEWAATNNALPTRHIDGHEIYALDEPEAIEAFRFLQSLYESGSMILGWGNRGRAAMEVYWSDAIQYSKYHQEDVWGVVPMPKGPSADKHLAPGVDVWMAVIPITTENPREVIEVYNALMQITSPYWAVDMDTMIQQIWQDGWRSMIVNDRESIEYMRWTAINSMFIPYVNLLNRVGWADTINQIITQGANPATVLQEFKPVVQAALDELLQQ